MSDEAGDLLPALKPLIQPTQFTCSVSERRKQRVQASLVELDTRRFENGFYICHFLAEGQSLSVPLVLPESYCIFVGAGSAALASFGTVGIAQSNKVIKGWCLDHRMLFRGAFHKLLLLSITGDEIRANDLVMDFWNQDQCSRDRNVMKDLVSSPPSQFNPKPIRRRWVELAGQKESRSISCLASFVKI